MKIMIKNDFENKEHLIDQLPDKLKEKVNKTEEKWYDDDIVGIDEIWLKNERKLIVKQELFYTNITEEDDYEFEECEIIDGKMFYADIEENNLELHRTKFFKFDDYDNGVPKSVWLLVEDVLKG